MVVLLGIGAGGEGMAQELTTVPFDPSLSMYVGHNGTWFNCEAGEEQVAEIEDVVAFFQPWEEVSDDPDVWAEHQVKVPDIPTGWMFFTAVAEQPMALHVIVHDTQNRLGQVVITNRSTGEVVGTLTANEQGYEVAGSIAVDPTWEQFGLQVKARETSATLLKAGADNPGIDKAVAVSLIYGWQPNRGGDHNGGPCPVYGLGPPWGNPASWDDSKQSTGHPAAQGMCAGPVEYVNDSPDELSRRPRYELSDRQIARNTAGQAAPGNLADQARQAVQDEISDALQAYHSSSGLPALHVVPFSQGIGHWPVVGEGEIRSILYFPFRGDTTQHLQLTPTIKAMAQNQWGAGVPSSGPSYSVVAALEAAWPEEEAKSLKILKPVAVGDIWGLRLITIDAPRSEPRLGIPDPVTFELWADLLPPAPGAAGRMGGSGTATKDAAWTTPEPPPAMPALRLLVFPGEGESKGLCTVELAKGWKWGATASPGMMMGYSGGTVDPFNVPPEPGMVRIAWHLVKLLCLKVKTEYADHTKAPSRVELHQLQGGQWTLIGGGDTVPQPPPNGDQIWTRGIPLDPGAYKIRAQSKEGMQPGPWTEVMIEAAIGIEKTETVTVVRGQGPGGP